MYFCTMIYSIYTTMAKKTLLFTLIAVMLAAMPATAQTDTTRNILMNDVVVTGTRNETDIRHLPMTISVVGRAQIEQDHQSSILPVLNTQVPGFFSTSRGVMGYGVSTGGSGQMSMRGIGGPAQAGLPTTGLLVLIDGHPQYMGLMGHPIADAYQSMLVERVEVVRGPASVLYGSNAMGGVVNIVTRRMAVDGIKTDIDLSGGSYGTFKGEAANRIRRGKFSSTITASYSRTDGHRTDMGFEQYGGYLKLGYDFLRRWKLWGDVNITHFNASNPGATYQPYIDNDQRITRGMASLALENHYDRTSGALSLFVNWGDHYINDGYEPGDEPLDYRFNSNDQMLGVSWYQSAQFFKGNRVTVGFDYFYFGGKAWNQFFDGRRVIQADQRQDEVAAYADFRQDIMPWLTIDAGVRFDHHSHTGNQVIPQAGLAFRLPGNSEVKAMASRGFRNPTIREMYMFPPQNPDLEPESLWNYELSYTGRGIDNRLTYSANLFYINGDNLILRLPNPNKSGMLNQNSGHIENFGAEAAVDFAINRHWSVNANYSWLHMENPVLASPEHKLYGGASFTHGRWNASTGLQYVKGLYTDLDTRQQEEFVLWNLSASFRATKWLSLYVRGENLLAQKYEIMAGYPMPRATFMGGAHLSF